MRFPRFIGYTCLLLALNSTAYAEEAGNKSGAPNIVLILTDDQGWSQTSAQMHPDIEESRSGYNKKCSFGLIRFDTTKSDPELTYDIVNIDNEVIYTLNVKRSELTFAR